MAGATLRAVVTASISGFFQAVRDESAIAAPPLNWQRYATLSRF